MYAGRPLEIRKVSDVINNPWDPLGSPPLQGYQWAVVQNARDVPVQDRDTAIVYFNAYDGYFAFIAVCPTEEAARAALRLLSL